MNESYQITLKGDGKRFVVDSKQTILQAALEQDVRLPYGCNNGQCYGCLQELVSGETEYKEPVTDVGDLLKYQTMLCKAYAKSDIELGCKQLPDLSDNEQVSNTLSEQNNELITENNNLPLAIATMTIPVKVIKNELCSEVVRQVDIQLPERVSFSFIAGQYIDILLDNGQRRSFSIANADNQTKVLTLYIKLVDKGYFTGYVFEHLTLNTIWTIEGPFGCFNLQANERPILLLAASTGIAPIYSMLSSIRANLVSQPIYLYWNVRYKNRLFLHEVLSELDDKLPNLTYSPVLSREDESWTGRRGYAHECAVTDLGDLSNFNIYASGSPAMINSAVEACITAGAQRDNIYLDIFSYQSS